jgi:hypothetical protein
MSLIEPSPRERDSQGRFAPGNAGRPVGSRNRLSQRVLRTLLTDFETHQHEVLHRMRHSFAPAYLSIIARVLPRQVEVVGPAPATFTAEETAIMIGRMRTALEVLDLGGHSIEDLEDLFIAAEQAAVGICAERREDDPEADPEVPTP